MNTSQTAQASCRQFSINQSRRGFSLIELLSVIAFTGALLSLAATTLNRAYHVHHTALKTFRELEQLNFWYERLLADAHQAVAIEIDSATRFTRADGQTVRYQVDQQQLIRIVERDSQMLSNEVLHSSPLAEVGWTSDTQGQLPLVTCELRFDRPKSALQPIIWRARMPLVNSQPSHSPQTSLLQGELLPKPSATDDGPQKPGLKNSEADADVSSSKEDGHGN